MRIIKRTGYTLTEVMIAVVLIGIIAGLAVPTYFTTIEQSRSNEAKSNIYTIWMAQKIYKLNNNKYYPPGSSTSSLSDINSNLNVELSSQYYTYKVTAHANSGAAASFTATAERGNAGAKTFQIIVTGSETAPPVVNETGNYN